MKKVLTLLVALISVQLYAQSYTPFPTSNAIWAEYYSPHEDSNNRMVYYGLTNEDTIINSTTYHKLFRSADTIFTANEYFGALREDSNKRIHFAGPTMFSGGRDIILFDFNFKLGDTIRNNYNNMNNNWYFTMTVVGEDSVQINGSYRRRLVLSGVGGYPSIWVEGMGNMVRGLIFSSGTFPNNGTWNELVCMKQGNSWTYHCNQGWLSGSLVYPPCEALSGWPPPQKVDERKNRENGITAYPNPLRGLGCIRFDAGNGFEVAELYNIAGVKVRSVAVAGKTIVPLNSNDFAPGLYFYRLKSRNGPDAYGKLIME